MLDVGGIVQCLFGRKAADSEHQVALMKFRERKKLNFELDVFHYEDVSAARPPFATEDSSKSSSGSISKVNIILSAWLMTGLYSISK